MPNLTIHVPHSSLHIPDDAWSEFLIDRDAVKLEAMTSADLYTDQMAREAWPNAEIVEAMVSRIIVDVERYENDALEEMAEVGRGVFYTHSHRQEEIRQDILPPRRTDLLSRYYTSHWARLRKAAAGAVLIDLHTYPLEPWPIERHMEGDRPEIDIGFTPILTPVGWVQSLTQHFSEAGFKVGHNTPYCGVIDAGARAAVMIEIRRDVVGRPGDNPKWRRLIHALKTMPLVERGVTQIKNCKIDVLPTGELKEVLRLASSGNGWSSVRKQAFERLHEIIEESEGILFNGDFRTYDLQTKGASAVFRVPQNQTKNLTPYRGQSVLIICLDYAKKWPSYSGRQFAALPISELGEILPAIRRVEEVGPN